MDERFKHAAAIVASLVLTAGILFYNPVERLEPQLGEYGYAGVFLVMLVSSATVILPVPGLLSAFAMGHAYNFALVGIAGGIGSALGELSGYLLGFGGAGLVEDRRIAAYEETKKWMRSNGFLTIFVLSALPNPVFDLAGIAAGSLGYPWWKFLAACALGKILKVTAFAYAGLRVFGFF
ncbi:MAG: VTT domain-containing protein [Candidatus ainarchaeum sp.]|nr:VTT domain-containing protein [Candidatus ainarchaeum sp.]